MSSNGIHVVRDANSWWVLRDGDSAAPAPSFRSAREAIRAARSLARAEKTEVTLYDESGRVRAWRDFNG